MLPTTNCRRSLVFLTSRRIIGLDTLPDFIHCNRYEQLPIRTNEQADATTDRWSFFVIICMKTVQAQGTAYTTASAGTVVTNWTVAWSLVVTGHCSDQPSG